MTIHVSKDAENTINAAVQGGLFASADEMIDKLVREFAQRTLQQQIAGQGQGSLGAVRDAADELAGHVAGDLDRTGQTIGKAEPMIGAIAVQHGLELVTGNTSHYQRIQQLGYPLTLVNWRV